ncbi:MAG: hypothetical protein WBL11_07555 [Bacteroidales bacterium]|nr:hypothetical protein [Bacteroidales bacterium]MDI9575807.1 hypothetical protein [Bacteroidota bacterium]MDD2593046.1 hypothetical protein [Bacteroidales bacterium]MDD3755592.1 hypothetical protein [Bacteroidales bacterium]MDY0400741.1 hypothetical protein [Bacteroidales bacterium]
MNKYLEFQINYPYFNYNTYNIQLLSDKLKISFDFDNGKFSFHPSSYWRFNKTLNAKKLNFNEIEAFVFNIGMIELISYWKATCSPIVNINLSFLSDYQTMWWKNLYYYGMGEFFYKNNIEIKIDEFIHFYINNFKTYKKPNLKYLDDNKVIVPIGGGKDSIVTLELLRRSDFEIIPLIINPNEATLRILDIAHIPRSDIIEIHRMIDPTLLELNKKGFFNGHTPFSAMLAFYSIFSAYMIGAKYIALSNEFSANESTVRDSYVNHQYSKSLKFENDFRDYVKKYLNDEIEYFSFLRPLHELQVVKLFTNYPQYFYAFRSCNIGSKNDSWCANCAKCLFVALMLSVYLDPQEIKKILGVDIFSNLKLKPIMDELLGLKETKPFECVGTIYEVRAVVNHLLMDKNYNCLPLFSDLKPMPAANLDDLEKSWNDIHFLPEKFEKLLKKNFY